MLVWTKEVVNSMRYYSKSPTDKQIAYAEDIAEYLNIDFPHSSADFTRAKYGRFIDEYSREYHRQLCCDDPTYEDEMSWFPMLNG